MPVESLKNIIAPIFEAISTRTSYSLNADFFSLIIVDKVNLTCCLLLNRDVDNFTKLEDDLNKIAPETWLKSSQKGFDSLTEIIEDTNINPVVNIFAEALICQKVLLAPFELDNTRGGFLVWAWQSKPSEFSHNYKEKAAFTTEQVALSLKLSLKEFISKDLNSKLTALVELSTAIYSSLNYKDVLEKAINLANKILDADGGTIFIIDKKSNLLKPLVTIDEKHEEEISQITLKLGEGLTGRVAQSGVGVISNHPENDPRTFHVPGTPENENESLISAPLTWSGEVIGVITLRSTKCKQFIQDDLDILTIFARHTADAIENAKLFESLEKAYQELSNTQEQLILTEKLRALGEMAGGVAHDFNNVLGTILGRTQLLLREVENDRWINQLKQIENVTLNGAKTVQKLQNFTRVSGTGQFEQVDLNRVINDVIEITRPRWKDECQRTEINIDLTFDIGNILPILGNKSDLIEAFSNIILNAIDALPDGGFIKIESRMKGNKVIVSFSDNGIGMGDGTLNRVFFPFFTTKGKQGTGMGLAVVYGIVSRHQGNIDVTSKPGEGTTFVLSFSTAPEVEQKIEMSDKFDENIKSKILVIDDDTNILEVIGDILEFLGHEVVLAATGENGVELFKNNQFDLVITDLGMPGISGWEVTRICKSLNPIIPVIMISGWGNQIDDETIKQSQLDGILAKPFEMKRIKALIQKVLASKTSISKKTSINK